MSITALFILGIDISDSARSGRTQEKPALHS